MKTKSIILLSVLGVLLLFVAISAASIFESNTAGYLQVKQAAVSGTMTCRNQPGMYLQMFGNIHTYNEADTFSFTRRSKEGKIISDDSLPARFNDGARAKVSGSVRIILPTNCNSLIKLHRKFHSGRGVMERLVLPAMRNALWNTGPHMSATESYAERRGEFASLVEDQLINGTILVSKKQVKRPDPITGKMKFVWVVEKRKCSDQKSKSCVGGFVRNRSAFHEFDIRVTNLVIDGIRYSQKVVQQIERQRKARMDIITQQAEAKRAEARASKAKAEALAAVAETRAKEEVAKTQMVVRAEATKAKAVLDAQRKRKVAELDAKAAALEKKANILRGEGQASRRLAIMKADGALSLKLKALVQIHKNYASALGKAKPGALVPQTVIGGGGGKSSSASDLVTLLLAKTAKDLSVNTNTSR